MEESQSFRAFAPGKKSKGDPSGPAISPDNGIVYLGMGAWDGAWHNRHFLLRRLARKMPVLYVEPWLPVRRIVRGRASFTARLRKELPRTGLGEDSGVRILRTSVFRPVASSGFVGKATLARWIARLRRAMSDTGIRNPILWVEHPSGLPVLGTLGEILSVYHIIDEYGGYTGITELQKARLAEREEQLLERVDLSIAVSDELRSAKLKAGRQIVVVPNAVDFDAFASAIHNGAEPREMQSIPRPVIGFCGLVGARLDLTAIDDAAASRPDYQFVFVGKIDPRECEEQLGRLAARRNVHFLGEKPGARVPEYIASFDVGLMPYRQNFETIHISPVKLYQYLAAGIPVVSSSIPAVSGMSPLINVVGPDADLATAIDMSLEDPASGRKQRVAFAAQHTWKHRVADILQVINSALAYRGALHENP